MSYRIKIESFEGPMDLLYHLIEKNKIDIYDIPIAYITEQYIEHIDGIDELNLEVTSEFILMASTLLEIKSKMLLPSKISEESEEDPREDLVKKLIEYKKYKLASTELKERNKIYNKVYYRLKEEIVTAEDEFVPEQLDLYSLLDSYKKVLVRYEEKQKRMEEDVEEEKEFSRVQRDDITIEEAKEIVMELILEKATIKFEDIFEHSGELSKNKIVTIFIALLELIKRKQLQFTQQTSFGEVTLTRRN